MDDTNPDTTVTTYVTAVVKTEVSDDERAQVLANHDASSLDEVAEELEEVTEHSLKKTVFEPADEVPVLEIRTEVNE